ncbi:hypothetical protein [Kutzneria buriramensis]|uniref:Uncharacterized protein n=1 Tax=Kutzneria buriramensis TaxID=1045776 RepID=A0A3E0HLR8_9PSEU|nr:hypothetical protein [Kutzneria buriramensis]REH47300.1 hypothetical protein BCF44_106465 [Kutzneria buriramensis]
MPGTVLPLTADRQPRATSLLVDGDVAGSGVPASRTNDLGQLARMLQEKFVDIVTVDTDPPTSAGWPARALDQKRHGDEADASTED